MREFACRWHIQFVIFKVTHREKSTLKLNFSAYENTNMDISVVGTSNLFYLRGSKTGTIFSKK